MTNRETKTILKELESITAELPVKVGFAIATNIRTLKAAVEVYDAEHDRLVRQYAADRKQVRPTDDVKGFAAALIELDSLDPEIALKPINLDDLEGLKLTVKQIDALLYLMEE